MSIIHIADHQTDEILDFIPEEDFWDDNHYKSLLDNQETFDFVTFANKSYSQYLQDMNRIIIPDEDGDWAELYIRNTRKYRDVDAVLTEVYTSATYVKLKTAKQMNPHSTSALSAEAHAIRALENTEWEVGTVDFKGIRSFTFDDYINPYDYLRRIASEFDLELRFKVETNGLRVTRRYVDLVEYVGTWEGKEVEFEKDLIGIERKEDFSNVVTALIGLGPEDEEGNRLSVLVEDEEALQRWGRNGQHIIGIYEPESTDTSMTIERLTTLTENELEKRINSQIQYMAEVVDLENVTGLDHEKFRFGSFIRIKDLKFNPPLYLEARVHTQNRPIKKRSRPKRVVLGDYIEYSEEDVNAIVKDLRKQLRNKIGIGDLEELTYTKPEVDQKVAGVVDHAEQAAVEVVDSIEIGGRNIASVDSVATTGVIRDGYTYTIAKTGSSNPFMRIPTSRFEENKRYVISFKVKKISGNVTSIAGHDQSFRGMPVEIYRDGVKIEDVTTWSVGDQNYPNDNEVHEYEIHLKTPETFPTYDSAPYWYIQPNRPNYGENYEIELWNFQIEQATKKSNWERPQDDVDKDIKEAKDEAEEAKQTAENAQQSANGKNTVFRQSTEPSSEGRINGDLWFKTDEGNKMFVWTGDWTPTELDYQALSIGELSAISADLGDVTSGKMTAVEVEGVTGTFGQVSVKNGDFLLEDEASGIKTTLRENINLVSDHSFELVPQGNLIDESVWMWSAALDDMDYNTRWTSSNIPNARMVIRGGLFNDKAAVLRALPYGTWDQVIQIPNNFIGYDNFTLSAHVAPFELTTFNVHVSIRLQALTSSGLWIADLASNNFTLDHTKKHEWMRVSVASTGGLPPNTAAIRVRLFLDNTTSASAMCLCDGVQLVPFEYPVPYYPESQVYRVMTGDDRVPNLQVNALVADGNAVFLGDSTIIRNANIANIEPIQTSSLNLSNNWSNYGSGTQSARAIKYSTGEVSLSGVVSGGLVGEYTMATLPAGLRPNATEFFKTSSPNGGDADIWVYPSGAIRVRYADSNSWVSLSGVRFHVG